eukprot:1651913-Rhodomonas_salina.1
MAMVSCLGLQRCFWVRLCVRILSPDGRGPTRVTFAGKVSREELRQGLEKLNLDLTPGQIAVGLSTSVDASRQTVR